MQTYILYSVVFLIIIMMTRLAQIKNSKKYMIYAAMVLTLLAGLRDSSVGLDTQGYVQIFDYIAEGQMNLAYGLETSFKYICFVLLKIWDNDNFLFFVFALITNVLIFDRIWDFKDQISLPWAITVYYAGFYFVSYNIMRQCVAVAIVFYATRYLYNKKYFRFLIGVLLACFFHKSSVIGIAFIFLEIFVRKRLSKEQIRRFVLLITIVLVAIVGFGAVFFEKYFKYFEDIQFNFGALLFVKLILFVLIAIVTRSELVSLGKDEKYDFALYTGRSIKLYYFLGILLTMLGYLFSYMDRSGTYYYIFETVFIGKVMRTKSVGIVKLLIAILYLILAIGTIFGNGQGQGNYLFFWQQI